jgi:WG containing repeat
MQRQCQIAASAALLSAMLWSSAAPAQPAAADLVPQCDGRFGLCRYTIRGTKEEAIPARFERAMPFSEGLAAVRIDGQFGYIDQRGEIVIAPKFDLAGNFDQGLAEILVGDQTGIINRAGEIIIQPMFQRAIPFTKDVVLATEGRWRSGYYQGMERLPGLTEGLLLHGQRIGLYHIKGHWIRRPDLAHVSVFARGGRDLIWATAGAQVSGPFGLLASDGTWFVEPQYDYGGPLGDDRAVVRKRFDGVMQSGAINANGDLVVPFRPWVLMGWANGFGLVRENPDIKSRQGVIDRDGNLIGGRFFDKVEPSTVGDVITVRLEGRFVGLDRAGNIVPHPRNGRLVATCPKFRVVEVDGMAQVTDPNGQQTAPYLFEWLLQRPTCDKPFPVQLGNKWGFVGLDGRLLFDPPAFDNMYGFEDGYAVVKQGPKWGIIDASGRFTHPPELDGFHQRRGGLFEVQVGGRRFWITATGEERPAPPVTYTRDARALQCGQGIRLAERGGLWGIVDSNGNDILAPRYRAVNCFRSGIAWVPVDDRREWCAVGPDGGLRERPACQRAHYPYIQTHSYPEKFHDDPFENSVLWTRAYLEFSDGRRETPPRWLGGRGR